MPHDRLWKEYWNQYSKMVKQRLEKGAQEYGSVSFSRHPKELLMEMREEVLDIAGWGLPLFARIQRMIEEIDRTEWKNIK